MKLIVQRVSRATSEVNGLVESRIGPGLLLMLGLRYGDTKEEARALAKKVLKIKFWPKQSLFDGTTDLQEDVDDTLFKSNVSENGFEVMAVFQPSLCATFSGSHPLDDEVMDSAEAQLIFEDFVKALRSEYQEEMVVAASIGSEVRLELTLEGPYVFDVSPTEVSTRGLNSKVPARKPPAALQKLEPDVLAVTRALRRIVALPRNRRKAESSRVFGVLALKQFLEALSTAKQAHVDSFAEALDAAGPWFTDHQQEKIVAWTGMAIASAPVDDAEADEGEEEVTVGPSKEEAGSDLERQLAELRDEVANPRAAAAKKALRVKEEPSRGDAAPSSAAAVAAAQQWAQKRLGAPMWKPPEPQYSPNKGKGKGFKGKGRRAIGGIVSLDESARLHGNTGQGFGYGQLARYSDTELKLLQVKQEMQERGQGFKSFGEVPEKRKADNFWSESEQRLRKLPKGTPTLAPTTPALQSEVEFADI